MLFIFPPIPGPMIQFDEHIFQMGWFNHQLQKYGFNWKNRKKTVFDCDPKSPIFRNITYFTQCYGIFTYTWNSHKLTNKIHVGKKKHLVKL